MENMDKGLTVPKGSDSSAENTQMPQNLSAQSPKILDFNKKGFIGRP